MSDFEFREENTIEAVFSMEVGREMNDHNKLYNRYADDQHPISAITGLTEALAEGSSNLQEEISRAEAAEQALDDKIEAETTRAEGVESGLNTAISNETSARQQADTTLQNNITAEENRAKGIENGLRSDLTAETTARQDADTGLQNQITTNANDIDNIEDLIPAEASASNQLADKSYVDTADNDLQSQIDAISASSDVTDIVGTYAELQAYDTSTLTNDDIIKVLQDESQGGATTYYRWVVTGSSGSFVLIGSEGPYYTKGEADELYDEKQDEITATNKLDSDLVDDSGQTNKFVTASEKAQISTNASNITTLQSGKADKSTTYTKTEVDTIATGKANVGLDNLNASGQMVVDSQNGTISNCILEIPQNLKFEVVSDGIVLKAGSVVCIPDSTRIYKTITTASDIKFTGNGNRVLFLRSNGTTAIVVSTSAQFSGDTNPEQTYSAWYNTTDNTVYHYGSSSTTPDYTMSFPLAVTHLSNSDNGSYINKDSNGNDMIFNGAGFIGHHAFVYPNVKALIPNGFNEDGSLKSFDKTNNALRIVELASDQNAIDINNYSSVVSSTRHLGEVDTIDDLPLTGRWYYVKSENITGRKSSQGAYSTNEMMKFIDYTYDGTTVTNWTPRVPVRLATTEMLDTLQDQVDTNTTTISGKQDDVTTLTGYDSTKTQTLKNVNGTLTWVDD